MKIEQASFEIMTPFDGRDVLRHIEACGRVSYASEDRTSENSAETFVQARIKDGHESLLEHFSFTTKFIVDRGVMAELRTHRLASFTAQSTRFVNFSKDKFGREITVIEPTYFEKDSIPFYAWRDGCMEAERSYFELLDNGCKPEEARSVLPNSLKTVIAMTSNLRELRTIFKLRTSKAAHPSMRAIMIPFLNDLKERIPVVFDDIEVE